MISTLKERIKRNHEIALEKLSFNLNSTVRRIKKSTPITLLLGNDHRGHYQLVTEIQSNTNYPLQTEEPKRRKHQQKQIKETWTNHIIYKAESEKEYDSEIELS